MQNKFLRIIEDAQYGTRIVDLHRELETESDQVIAKLLDNAYTYKHEHNNLFICNTGYNIEKVLFQIRYRQPKHFQSINTNE